MKYWRGYIAAAAFALLTFGLTQFAAAHSHLVDMVYPYASRLVQDVLAEWSAGTAACLWQVLAVVLGVLFLASVAALIIFRWNFLQWLGWVLASLSLLWCVHTGMYGLNRFSSPLAEDIHLNTVVIGDSITPLIDATTYFRDKANEYALLSPRNDRGNLLKPDFKETAEKAANGFDYLVYEKNYPVFAGVTTPVKELGWADMYSSMGITGVTVPFTGEAAVNPQIPTVALPFTICHEMAHRMCIASERDASLAAFLASTANSDPLYQYSGYLMAFRYCYNSLATIPTTTATDAANRLYEGLNESAKKDLDTYSRYFDAVQGINASELASTINDVNIKPDGDKSGIRSYGQVTDLLLSWYWQEIYLPTHTEVEEEDAFDPFDEEYVYKDGLLATEGQ